MAYLSQKVRFGCLLLLLFFGSTVQGTSQFGYTGPKVREIAEVAEQSLTGLKAIVQDKSGFMWLASNQGLLRFDGQSLKRFEHQQNNPNSLPDNDIRGLVEDESGYLWLITRGGGLSRFNPQTEQFDNFYSNAQDPQSIDSNQLNSLSLGAEGILWIGSNRGINRFDRNSLKNTRLNGRLLPQQDGERDNIQRIFEDSQGRLWFSIRRKGLYLYSSQSAQLRHFEHRSDQAGTLDDNTVSEIFESREGTIWIGTASGINRFEPDNATFTTLPVPLKRSNKVEHASVTRIFEDRQNNLWVGTFYNGVSRLKPGADSLVELNTITGAPDSLNALHINDIVQDSSGTIWFVTPRSGLITLRPEHLHFSHLKVKANSDVFITALTSDDNGNIWLGSNRGLFVQREGEAAFTAFGAFDSITAMNAWPGNGIVINSTRQGLLIIDVKGRQTTLPLMVNVNTLSSDGNGQLYLGADSGLYRYDPEQLSWQMLSDDFSIEQIAAIGLNIIVRTKINGLKRWNMSEEQWFDIAQNQPINQIYLDNLQQLWLTDTNGALFKLDRQRWQIEQAGFGDAVVSSIVSGRQGDLWLATDKGIVRYDNSRQTYELFDSSHGLLIDDFAAGLATALPNGDIAMANQQALVRFAGIHLTGDRAPERISAKILLSDFKLFNQAVLPQTQDPQSPIATTIDKTKTLVLNYQQNWFSIAFASSNYSRTDNLQYSYRMEGLSDKWIETDSDSRVASFTSVNPGKYTLLFRITDPSGEEKENIRSIDIVITPPWWSSNLAYALYVLGAGLMVYLFNFVRTRALRIRAARLEQAVADRTAELKQRADTIAQLLEDKEALIANISHEFRTPLTLILGPLQSQLENAKDQQSQALLSMAKANGKRLLNMVDQLLDMARMKDQAPEHRQIVDVLQTGRMLLSQFENLGRQHNIVMVFEKAVEGELLAQMQPDALEKILSNLLSNAIKYGGDNQTITLKITDDNNKAVLSVSDTGPGISEDDQRNIFERFTRLKNDSGFVPGAGIGLALVKELVELHQGHIRVTSVLGSGTTFTVELPRFVTTEVVESTMVNAAFLEAAAEQLQVNQSNRDIEPVKDTDKPHILVIEDNQDMRRYIVSSLAEHYCCHEAQDGEEGLKMAEQVQPELVLSDVMMPKMDGFEVTKRLKKDNALSHIPVVLLTARGDKQSRLRGWSEKADEYLEKPFNAEELRARIDNLLAQRALLRQQFQAQFSNGAGSPEQPEEQIQDNPLHQSFLNQVNSVLEQHYQDDTFDIARFSDAMALSHRQLGRKMKSLLDMTPAEALRNYRLQKAAELLLEGVTPSVASHKSGFSTHSYFSQCFKSRFHCSPSEYIKKSVSKTC